MRDVIKDFRTTRSYQIVIKKHPHITSTEDLVVKTLHEQHKSSYITLNATHTIDKIVATSIEIPISSTLYDGIYDIWLIDCINVTDITVCFDNVEIHIPEFKQSEGKVQIPLTFDETTVFYECKGFNAMHVSFIPTIAMSYDRLRIKLNSSAVCKVQISTIYFTQDVRKHMIHSSNMFYVNGVPLITRCGAVWKHTGNNQCVVC